MRDARAEASERVGGRYDVRVLEPSPPAVNEAPWFADDPVAGGDVVPIERPGATSWTKLCADAGDDALLGWCEDRWLVRRPLRPLPQGFAATRVALHALAEHVVAPARHAANGKIGLRYTWHGFGTPFSGDDRQVRVEDDALVAGDRREPLTTLAAAAAIAGVVLEQFDLPYAPTTRCEPDVDLGIDAAASRAVGDWFGFGTSLLEQLRAEADEADAPSRVQIWPEHFDVAVDLGPEGKRANFGASPGDEGHPEPYLYVGPWEPRSGDFWHEPFGASLSYADILGGRDPLAFLREGREEVQR